MIKVCSVLLLLSISISLALAVDICEYQMNGVRLAHPADCNKFVVCKRGRTERIMSCPIGLHFNRFKGVCDIWQRAACDIEFIEYMGREKECSNCCAVCNCGETTPMPEPTPKPDKPNCGNDLTVCVNKPDGSVSYVNGTCNQYIVCKDGCAHIMTCPSNLQYNFETNRCDYAENVNCPWSPRPPITGPSGVTCAHRGKCAGKPDGTMFSNPNSNGYIICQCECEIERPCPDGTKFDEKLKVCVHSGSGGGGGESGGDGSNGGGGGGGSGGSGSENVGCDNDVKICTNQPEGTLFPVNGVCNKFYKCNYGCAVEFICPNNLIYNPHKGFCDYPQNYNCPWPYTPPSGPATGPSGIACPNGGRCVGKSEGTLFPSLNNCSKYVTCQCECEVEMDCPDGLFWDKDLLTCNYASNVQCTIHH